MIRDEQLIEPAVGAPFVHGAHLLHRGSNVRHREGVLRVVCIAVAHAEFVDLLLGPSCIANRPIDEFGAFQVGFGNGAVGGFLRVVVGLLSCCDSGIGIFFCLLRVGEGFVGFLFRGLCRFERLLGFLLICLSVGICGLCLLEFGLSGRCRIVGIGERLLCGCVGGFFFGELVSGLGKLVVGGV